MTKHYRAIDGGTGHWAVRSGEVFFIDTATGKWSRSSHSAAQLQGWARLGLLEETEPPPFLLSATGGS
ncbi:Hypothetical protein AJAP_27870 [Amycolatopsis japonica]|uniref:Uncharacterized protein n=1 Tax=Amycolatopsis japonica TaxID=208439 RepID=A0A075UZL2_9PSEU|nr:Hypothetical protein AJAP_27870 [Amycolatopsis japonica]